MLATVGLDADFRHLDLIPAKEAHLEKIWTTLYRAYESDRFDLEGPEGACDQISFDSLLFGSW